MRKFTQEDLHEAGVAMKLASMDYDDNSGSSESNVFWRYFEEKRRDYIYIKDEMFESS